MSEETAVAFVMGVTDGFCCHNSGASCLQLIKVVDERSPLAPPSDVLWLTCLWFDFGQLGVDPGFDRNWASDSVGKPTCCLLLRPSPHSFVCCVSASDDFDVSSPCSHLPMVSCGSCNLCMRSGPGKSAVQAAFNA